MRLPSLRRTWWNETSFCSVALYSFTGIVTSPKLMAPFQIDLTVSPVPVALSITLEGRPGQVHTPAPADRPEVFRDGGLLRKGGWRQAGWRAGGVIPVKGGLW